MFKVIAGLVTAADIARQNGDTKSAGRWESTADSWRSSIADRMFPTDGYWGGHRYYERIGLPTLRAETIVAGEPKTARVPLAMSAEFASSHQAESFAPPPAILGFACR